MTRCIRTTPSVRRMTLESKDTLKKIGGSPALPVSHGSTIAEPRGCKYRWRGLKGPRRRNLHSEITLGRTAGTAERQVRAFPAFLLAGEQRSADAGRTRGVGGRSEDVTCSMVHWCFLNPESAKLSTVIDYAGGERLVRVEADGSDAAPPQKSSS